MPTVAQGRGRRQRRCPTGNEENPSTMKLRTVGGPTVSQALGADGLRDEPSE